MRFNFRSNGNAVPGRSRKQRIPVAGGRNASRLTGEITQKLTFVHLPLFRRA
jgi:hypothetical protein